MQVGRMVYAAQIMAGLIACGSCSSARSKQTTTGAATGAGGASAAGVSGGGGGTGRASGAGSGGAGHAGSAAAKTEAAGNGAGGANGSRAGAGGASSAGPGGAGGSAGTGGSSGAPALPTLEACDWAGARCENALDATRLCAGGHVIAVQPCQKLGCRDGSACVTPGAPGALAAQTTNPGPPLVCPANQPKTGCGPCLHMMCCDALGMCDGDCITAWQCLNKCGADIACAAKCDASAFQVVTDCAEKKCSDCVFEDPCAGSASAWASRCGSTASGLDPASIYLCIGTKIEGVVPCKSGCKTGASARQTDYCAGTDPCTSVPYDGYVCGSLLVQPDAIADLLYNCKAQTTQATFPCSGGCKQAAPLEPYTCKR